MCSSGMDQVAPGYRDRSLKLLTERSKHAAAYSLGRKPQETIVNPSEPAEQATALPPASRALNSTLHFTWGLRPRLYAATRFAGYAATVSITL